MRYDDRNLRETTKKKEKDIKLILIFNEILILRRINRLFSLLFAVLMISVENFIAYMLITQFGGVLLFAYYINIFSFYFRYPSNARCFDE